MPTLMISRASMDLPGGPHPLHNVAPAKRASRARAGIHRQCRQRWNKALVGCPVLRKKRRWLWVPACAGTTSRNEDSRYFFAARSTKVLPPFILCANGASLIWMTTASASTPRFFTSASVMSRIMQAFWSSLLPAAMLMVISGIFVTPFAFATRHEHDPHSERAAHLAPTSSSAKADDPVFRAVSVQLWRRSDEHT